MTHCYTWRLIDPGKNRYRFYTLSVERDLWGHWAIVRRWGRLDGTRTGMIVDWNPSTSLEQLAREIHQRRTTHEYQLIDQPPARDSLGLT